MFYVVEEKHTQVDKENNIWSSSISILAVNSEKWRIDRYFKKIWIRYEHEHGYVRLKVVNDDRVVFFGPGALIVDLYITNDINYSFEA